MKTRLWILVALSLLLALGRAAVAEPKTAPADTPAHAAESFFAALKARDLQGATELCDTVVQSFTPYGAMEGWDVPADPEMLVKVMASRVTDSWTTDSEPEHVRIASGGRAYDPKNFFRADKTYYVLADTGFDKTEWATFAENEEMDLKAVGGFVIFLHQVNGRWLVFRVVEQGLIGVPQE